MFLFSAQFLTLANSQELPVKPEQGKAIVYLIRTAFLPRYGVDIFLDSKEKLAEIGTTKGKNYIFFNVVPGKHTIYAKAMNWAESTFDAKENDVIFIMQDVSGIGPLTTTELVKIDKDDGIKKIHDLAIGSINYKNLQLINASQSSKSVEQISTTQKLKTDPISITESISQNIVESNTKTTQAIANPNPVQNSVIENKLAESSSIAKSKIENSKAASYCFTDIANKKIDSCNIEEIQSKINVADSNSYGAAFYFEYIDQATIQQTIIYPKNAPSNYSGKIIRSSWKFKVVGDTYEDNYQGCIEKGDYKESNDLIVRTPKELIGNCSSIDRKKFESFRNSQIEYRKIYYSAPAPKSVHANIPEPLGENTKNVSNINSNNDEKRSLPSTTIKLNMDANSVKRVGISQWNESDNYTHYPDTAKCKDDPAYKTKCISKSEAKEACENASGYTKSFLDELYFYESSELRNVLKSGTIKFNGIKWISGLCMISIESKYQANGTVKTDLRVVQVKVFIKTSGNILAYKPDPLYQFNSYANQF